MDYFFKRYGDRSLLKAVYGRFSYSVTTISYTIVIRPTILTTVTVNGNIPNQTHVYKNPFSPPVSNPKIRTRVFMKKGIYFSIRAPHPNLLMFFFKYLCWRKIWVDSEKRKFFSVLLSKSLCGILNKIRKDEKRTKDSLK